LCTLHMVVIQSLFSGQAMGEYQDANSVWNLLQGGAEEANLCVYHVRNSMILLGHQLDSLALDAWRRVCSKVPI
jgi:hypothetical protein